MAVTRCCGDVENTTQVPINATKTMCSMKGSCILQMLCSGVIRGEMTNIGGDELISREESVKELLEPRDIIFANSLIKNEK